MKRVIQWSAITLLGLLLFLLAATAALQRWIGTGDFRVRIEQEASAALGVGVQLGQIDVALWPLPALSVDRLLLQTRPALSIERIEVRPVWADLMRGHVAPDTLIVRRAVLPQPAIEALLVLLQKRKSMAAEDQDRTGPSSLQFLPRRTVLDAVRWVDAKGAAIVLQADAQLSADALPQTLTLQVLQGRLQGTRLGLQREGDAWDVALQVAGGTVKGRVVLERAPAPGAEFTLRGQLQTQGVEVSMLTAAVPMPQAQTTQPLSGRLEATTTFSARTRNPATLADVLQTQSRFTVQKAVLHGLDLAKAVKTVGMSRGGQTPLDTLAGQVSTRGRAIELSQLVASSGVLSATGHAAIAPDRRLSGRVSVELGGAVGVPLAVGGTLSEPEVTLTRGAMIGAAVGTVLLPGVGTGTGASLGDKASEGLKKLFGK